MKNKFPENKMPLNEQLRLEVLNKYVVLNGFPDKYFNQVACIIAKNFSN
jgi:hypothetical protein